MNELKSNVEAVAEVVRLVLTVNSRPAVPVLLAPTSGAVYQKTWAGSAVRSAPSG
ncbi:hypothetical protein D3C85_1660350 [compost metagenome]